jgi:hypothetical protein
MAIFTQVTMDQASNFIQTFELGKLLTLRGIPSGIENTNYFLNAEDGEFVLTLFERLTPIALPYYLRLMRHLATNGIPVPEPRTDRFGNLLFELNGKLQRSCAGSRDPIGSNLRRTIASRSARCSRECTLRVVTSRTNRPTCVGSAGGSKLRK